MSNNDSSNYPEIPPPPGRYLGPPAWKDGTYHAAPPTPADWVPGHTVAHTPPVVSPNGMVTNSPVVYAINPYKNTTCITALVLGLATFVTFGFTAIPAIVTGHIGLTQCQKGTANQKGMAVTGLALGYLAAAGWTLFWVMGAIGAASGSGS